MFKKAIRDLFSTLYDDLEFKCLSLPRVLVAIGFIVVLIAWIMEQFFGKPCPHFAEICTFFGGGSMLNFAWTKWTDLRDPLIHKLNNLTGEKDDKCEKRPVPELQPLNELDSDVVLKEYGDSEVESDVSID